MLFNIYSSKMSYRVLESVFRLTVWLHKERPRDLFFELGLNGSGLGLMIFHKLSPRTDHTLYLFVTKSQ